MNEEERKKYYDDMIRISQQVIMALKSLDAFLPDNELNERDLRIKRATIRKPIYDASSKLKITAEMIRFNKF